MMNKIKNLILVGLIVVGFFVASSTFAASAAFDDSNWTGYFTVDNNTASTTATTSDLMVDLGTHAPVDFWNNVSATGSDVRITNSAGDTAYSFELENFNGTSTGILYFDSQQMTSTTSATTWRIYAGNSGASMPAASDTLGSENVWDTNQYLDVYHGETVNSSVASGNNGTNNNFTLNGTGKVGGAWVSDAAGDYMGMGSNIYSNSDVSSGGAVMAWVNYNSINGNRTLDYEGVIQWISQGDDKMGFYIHDTNDNNVYIYSSSALNTGQWYFLVVTWDGSTEKCYVDAGAADDSTSKTYPDFDSVSRPNAIGSDRDGNNAEDVSVDELRLIGDTTPSQNWIQTHHNNQASNGTFWTAGSWTTGAAPAGPTPYFFWWSGLQDFFRNLV